MKRLPVSDAAVIWMILCTLSVISVVQMAEGRWSWVSVALVILIAGIKARLVIQHYMEANRARPLWRIVYNAWNVVVGAAILAGYLFAAS